MKKKALLLVLFLSMAADLFAGIRISAIEISGNHRTDPDIIRNYLYFRESETMSLQDLEKNISRSKTRLLNTRYFSSVEIKTVFEEPEGTVRIEISIREGFLWRLNGGTWWIEGGRDNLFGKGVNGSLLLSRSTQAFTLNSPYFRGSPFLVGMQFAHQISGRDIVFVDPEEDFEYERLGASWSIGYNFNPDLSMSLNAGIYSFALDDEEFGSDAELFLREHGVRGRTRDTDIGYLVSYDRRNDRLVPSSGYLLRGLLTFRDRTPGFRFQTQHYLKMGRRTYLFTRIWVTNFDDTLPYHMWQSLGGIHGLKFPDSGDLIGRSTLLLSVEPRWRFLKIPSRNIFLEARIFLDTGAAYQELSDFSLEDFATGYGAGLSFWIGYPYFQNTVLYYGIRRGEGKLFFRFGSSF